MEVCQREVQALKHVVQRLLERPPDASSPYSMEAVIQTVQPMLLNTMHSELRPMLVNMGKNVEDFVQTKNDQLYNAVLSRIGKLNTSENSSPRSTEDAVSSNNVNGE